MIKDYEFPCYKRNDTIHEAEVFLEDWNHAYADSWRWTVRNMLGDRLVAGELGTDINSILLRIGYDLQDEHEPKKANDSLPRRFGKLQGKQINQASLSCESKAFSKHDLKEIPQHIATLAATSELQDDPESFDAFDENFHQQSRLQIRCPQDVGTEEMHLGNEDEKARQKDFATQIESLRATVHEREIKIAELSRNVESLRKEVGDLKSACSQEVAKLSQSVKDITTLQNNLKDKDKVIDQMKTAGSKLKSVLSSEQKKNGELEAANASMSTELRAIRARIEKMDDFTVQSSDIDDDLCKLCQINLKHL